VLKLILESEFATGMITYTTIFWRNCDAILNDINEQEGKSTIVENFRK